MLVRNLCFLLRTIVVLVRNLFGGITHHFKHLMFYFLYVLFSVWFNFSYYYYIIILNAYYFFISAVDYKLYKRFWPYINFFTREKLILFFWRLVKIDYLFTNFFFVREAKTYLYTLRSYPCTAKKTYVFCILDCSYVSQT